MRNWLKRESDKRGPLLTGIGRGELITTIGLLTDLLDQVEHPAVEPEARKVVVERNVGGVLGELRTRFNGIKIKDFDIERVCSIMDDDEALKALDLRHVAAVTGAVIHLKGFIEERGRLWTDHGVEE